MRLPKAVRMVEVGPRDGLQNEAQVLPAATKVALIEQLVDAGLTVVEAGSFVSPKWIPQMADTAAVLAMLKRKPGVSYPVLVPNIKGRGVGELLAPQHQLLDRRELRALRTGGGSSQTRWHADARLYLLRRRLSL
jgi:hypothetical protein